MQSKLIIIITIYEVSEIHILDLLESLNVIKKIEIILFCLARLN